MPKLFVRISVCILLVTFPTISSGQATATQSPSASAKPAHHDAFLVEPYLQWGRTKDSQGTDSLTLAWHSDDHDALWSVEVKPGPDQPWSVCDAPEIRRVAAPTIAAHRVYNARLTRLVAGTDFDYRVIKAGVTVFTARAHARKSANQPYRFVAFGDCAAGTPAQKAIAYRAYLSRPDFIFIPGDIVYARGRISEYRQFFFPVYNADEATPALGAPLLRSTLFVAAPGNHDTATPDLDRYPDGLAYFLYWSQPIDSAATQAGGPNTPLLTGSETNRQQFLKAAGAAYPTMTNFSFNYANAHWTVLDANTYVNWTDPALRAWVERDLTANADSTWRFVGFHQPGFNSSHHHFDEQRMRLLADLFEKCGVDLVFTGHVHNYQRTFPIRFVARKNAQGEMLSQNGRVEGTWTSDKSFDGKSNTHPSGVIYLITGAGGANLYDPQQQSDPASWQSFTHKFISKVHSFTVVDVAGRELMVRQLATDGAELDSFTVTK